MRTTLVLTAVTLLAHSSAATGTGLHLSINSRATAADPDAGRSCMQQCASPHVATMHKYQAANNYAFRIEHLPTICHEYNIAVKCAQSCPTTTAGESFRRIRYDMDYPCDPVIFEQLSTRLKCLPRGARQYQPCTNECRDK